MCGNSVDSDQLASDEASWSESTLFKKQQHRIMKKWCAVCLLGQIGKCFMVYFQSKARRKKCCLIVVLLVILAVIGIIVAIVVTSNN